MNRSASIPLDDLGSPFVEALETWSEHLKGKLEWNHRSAAAHLFFSDVLEASWSPGRVPSEEEWTVFENLAPLMDDWKDNPGLFVPRMLDTLINEIKPGIRYINSSLGVTVHAIQSPRPRPINLHPLPTFDWMVRYVSFISRDDPPAHTGGVAARPDDSQPVGFPIKGNRDSMLYHLPGGRWYKTTIAEVWFADEEAAVKAGFKPSNG